MFRLRPFFAGVAAVLLLSTLSLPASAGTPVGVQPPVAKPSFFLPAQLNQQLQALIGTSSAAPAAGTPAPALAPTTTAGNTNDNGDETTVESQETFGTKALNLFLGFVDLLAAQGRLFIENFADLPQVNGWLARQISDPHLIERWKIVDADLLAVGNALLAALALELLLMPARRHLRRRQPSSFAQRFGPVLGLLGLGVAPILLFITVALTLLDQNEQQRVARFAVLNVIYALALSRLLMVAGRTLLTPEATAIRLIPVATPQAHYLYRWLGLFGFVAVYGYFCVDVARLVHMPEPPVTAFSNLLGLILVLMTITVIVQKRAAVAVLVRGELSAARRDLTLLQSLRLWLARRWHVLAIAYLLIGYFVTALGIEGGIALLLRGTVLTLLVLVTVELLFHALARSGTKKGAGTPVLQHPVSHFFLRLMVGALALLAIAAGWGANIPALLATPIGQRIAGGSFSIGITVIFLTLIYQAVSSAIERHLNRQDGEGQAIQASARMRTLLPMLRTAAFIVFSIVAGLVVLSEVGINIGPLLAGAGVIGVAIGFGSQTLVKDFLTGLFIVVENTIAIGDVVTIGTHTGVVEALSVRTLRLRDGDGAVHILPFSEVSQIVNMTREFAYAQVSVGVAYDTDLRHAMDVIRAVGEELRADAKMRSSILDPVEILGVDKFGDSAITLMARIRTRPGRQWDVKRAFLLQIKERFDLEKIEIPYPTVKHI